MGLSRAHFLRFALEDTYVEAGELKNSGSSSSAGRTPSSSLTRGEGWDKQARRRGAGVRSQQENIDDVKFVRLIVDRIGKEHKIDRSRVLCTGNSTVRSCPIAHLTRYSVT